MFREEKLVEYGKVMRIRPELCAALQREAKESFPGVDPKLAHIMAQKRIANIIDQSKRVFEIPKFKTEFDLRKCHIKKI